MIKDAYVAVIQPPPVQGLGAAGGFKPMVEDRGGLGPHALSNATNALVAAANSDPAFGGVFTLYNAGAPSIYADIDRTKAERVGLTPSDVFSTPQLYLSALSTSAISTSSGGPIQYSSRGMKAYRRTPEDITRLRIRKTRW